MLPSKFVTTEIFIILLKSDSKHRSIRSPRHSLACTGFKPCVHTQDTRSKLVRTRVCMCGRQTRCRSLCRGYSCSCHRCLVSSSALLRALENARASKKLHFLVDPDCFCAIAPKPGKTSFQRIFCFVVINRKKSDGGRFLPTDEGSTER